MRCGFAGAASALVLRSVGVVMSRKQAWFKQIVCVANGDYLSPGFENQQHSEFAIRSEHELAGEPCYSHGTKTDGRRLTPYLLVSPGGARPNALAGRRGVLPLGEKPSRSNRWPSGFSGTLVLEER